MSTRAALVFAALACSLSLARGAAAQSPYAQLPYPLTVDANVGVGVVSGGTYVDRGAVALEALIGYRLQPTRAGTLVAGLSLGIHAPAVTEDRCELLSNGDCTPGFPLSYSAAALLGVQRGTVRTASARFMAGPVYYHADEGGGALGLRGLVDVATPPWHRAAVVASLRHSLLPSLHGEVVGITSFGIGLRLQ